MNEYKKELTENILPFWVDKLIDHENGGFYGTIDGNNELNPYANKGIILTARILWTFSSSYRVLQDSQYLSIATRAYEYIKNYFLDKQYGGAYWELDYLGNPVNKKKQTYAQGFCLYAFSEYYRATNDKEALNLSIELFECIERCKDQELGGYWEAFTETWQPIEDMRLSDKDINEAKTMNTHLHILEPYTNLIRIWPDPKVIQAQQSLITVFLERIYSPSSGHLQLFFDRNWTCNTDIISYGHDIEAAWLLIEAASILADDQYIEKVKRIAYQIAQASTAGLLADGSMAYELKDGHFDEERHWWVQAEAVVGYAYIAKLFNEEQYKTYANRLWDYIQQEIVDHQYGEWYWSRLADGSVNTREDKAGFWKCPYHNSRMCLEMIEHF